LTRAILLGLVVFAAVGFALHSFLEILIVAPAHSSRGGLALNAGNLSALLSIFGAMLAVGSFLLGRARLLFAGIGRSDIDSDTSRVSSYQRSILKRMPKRVVMVIDEVDRCDPDRVLEIIRACNQLMLAQPPKVRGLRRRRNKNIYTLACILLSEREWLYNAIESNYPFQLASWLSKTKRLGSYFMEKLALISFDLPTLSTSARAALVGSATGEEAVRMATLDFESTIASEPAPKRVFGGAASSDVTAAEESGDDWELGDSADEDLAVGILRPVLSSTGDPKNRELVERAAEVERRMQLERKYIAQYSNLIGRNPREIKRVLVRYWLDRVMAVSEERDVGQFAEAILFESVVTVRWPNLYPAIRERRVSGVASLRALLGGEQNEDLDVLVAALDQAWSKETRQSSSPSRN